MAITIREGFPKIFPLGGGLKMEVTIVNTVTTNTDSFCSKLSQVLAATCSDCSTTIPVLTRNPVNISNAASGGTTNGRIIKLTQTNIASATPVCVIAFGR